MIQKVMVEHSQNNKMKLITFHPNQEHLIVKWDDGRTTTYKYEFVREE